MKTLSYSALRSNLANALNQVAQNHQALLITRKNGEDAVLMSAQDFRSYEETAYLLSSATNAKRLNEALQEVQEGIGVERKLIENLQSEGKGGFLQNQQRDPKGGFLQNQ